MLEQWVPFAVLAGIVAVSFLSNVALGTRVADSMNSASIEINTPWRRPRLLAGKSLVTIWFITALLYIAMLAETFVVDGIDMQISSLPALLLLAATTISVITYKRSLAQQTNTALDERERGIRNTLYLTSYRIATSVLAGVWLTGFVSKFIVELEVNLDQIPTDTALGISATAAAFLWVLPSLVHAWTDPVPDEVSDEVRDGWKTAKREIKREIAKIRKDLPKSEKAALAELRKADRKLDRTRTKKKAAKRS
jgi:hypothetical protein